MDKYSGKRLDGRYEIHELIGVGGMALVYRAYDTIDDRTVAIKILKDEFLGNAEFIRRFKNESKAIAVLSHPNIVKVYDVSFGDRIQYIVEEFIDGITLKDYLSQQKEIKWKEAIHFTVQILQALQHAHEKGIVHRDIKPQNIMLLQDGTIKVTDFGIARFSRSETRTITDKAIGSVHYIAPEQARGDLTDEKADIYSVGVMLYEMLTGQLPFEADNAVSVAIMQMQADPRPPKDINPAIPDGLEEITLRAMQKNPAQRYQSAAEMLADIEAFKRNPSIVFEYKYFSEDNAGNYANAIHTVKGSDAPVYDDDFEYEEVLDRQHRSGRKNKAMLVGIGILAAFLIVGIALGVAALIRSFNSEGEGDVEVPNFVGESITDILENEEYKDIFVFKQDNSKKNLDAEVGEILDQKPSAGMKVHKGTEITLYVNSGGKMVEIPDLTNYTAEDAAKELLEKYNLNSEVVEISDDTVEEGRVIRTDPPAGTSVAEKSVIVTLYVSGSSEGDMVAIPSELIGMNIDDARTYLLSMGLELGDTVAKDDTGEPEGTILETSPLPGVKVEKGTKINVVYSSGKMNPKTVKVNVALPTEVNYDVHVKAYLGSELMEESTINPSYNGIWQLSFDISENKELTIEIDGQKWAVYTLDFATGKSDQTWQGTYTPPVSSEESSEPEPPSSDPESGLESEMPVSSTPIEPTED